MNKINKIKDVIENIYYGIVQYYLSGVFRLLGNMKQHGFFLKYYKMHIKSLKAHDYECDDVLLHANFQVLVDFVEQDCTNYAKACDFIQDNPNNYKVLGLCYLDSYIKDEFESYEMTHNGKEWKEACKKIKELYLWWTIERNNRRTIDELHKVNFLDFAKIDYAEYLSMNLEQRNNFEKSVPGFKKNYKKWSKQCLEGLKAEEKYYEEDTEKTVELIKLRKFLWV